MVDIRFSLRPFRCVLVGASHEEDHVFIAANRIRRGAITAAVPYAAGFIPHWSQPASHPRGNVGGFIVRYIKLRPRTEAGGIAWEKPFARTLQQPRKLLRYGGSL
jgi:hypothetical protein